MTFMLGAFTDGLTSGAKWASGLWDDKARRDSINEDTRGHKLTNDANQAAYDAAKKLPPGTPAADASGTGVSSTAATDAAGTTGNPVASTDLSTVQQPAHLKGLNTSGPFGPTKNPELSGGNYPAGTTGVGNTDLSTNGDTNIASAAPSTAPPSPVSQMYGNASTGALPVSQMYGNAGQGPAMTPTQMYGGGNQGALPVQQMYGGQQTAPPAPTSITTGPGTTGVASRPNGTVRNRPVGAAIHDWLHGTATPDQPLKHGPQTTAALPLPQGV